MVDMDGIKSKLFKTAKSVTDSSGYFIKTAKLNLQLSNEEDQLKSIYLELGKKIHEIYEYGGSLGSFFDEKYKELLTVQDKINAIKEQIEVAKGTKQCPGCKKNVSRTAEFCPSCGHDMSGIKAPKDENKKEAAAGQVEIPQSGLEAEEIPSEETTEPTAAHTIAETQNTATEIAAGKTCPVCGKQNNLKDKFCFSCGRFLS